jgi:hypothetical protein
MLRLLLFPLLLSIAVLAGPAKSTRWQGTLAGDVKGAQISFVVSPDGKTLSQIVFSGSERTYVKQEQTASNPEQSFAISNGKVSGVKIKTDKAAASAWSYELQGEFTEKSAKGTLLDANGHQMQWTATPAL